MHVVPAAQASAARARPVLCLSRGVRCPDTPNLHLPPRRLILHLSPCRNVIEGFAVLPNVIAFMRARASIIGAYVASIYIEFTSVASLAAAQFAEAVMTDSKFLTPEEVSERYRGGVSIGTLRNWRAMRIGPTFVKIGKAVLYPTDELDAWDRKNMVTCRASKRLGLTSDDAA